MSTNVGLQQGAQLQLKGVKRPGGFAAERIEPGQVGNLWPERFVYSDQVEFYEYLDKLSDIYLPGVVIDIVSHFLAVHHEDESVDVYVNQVPAAVEILAKRDLKAGDPVALQDMADITGLTFPTVSIGERDNLVFCFKRGWKFGLYFNFRQSQDGQSLDIQNLARVLGYCYKFLSFQEEYAVLEQTELFDEMQQDGWFPFIQFLGGKFRQLATIYREKDQREERLDRLMAEFDQGVVEAFVGRWWKQPFFGEHKEVLEAGVGAFLRNTQEGFISCIKILYSEIDGMMRRHFTKEQGREGKFRALVDFTHATSLSKFTSIGALGFPDHFAVYLSDVFLKKFDAVAENPEFSRHSALHGVARPDQYTKVRALQAILILDQLYFSLPAPLQDEA